MVVGLVGPGPRRVVDVSGDVVQSFLGVSGWIFVHVGAWSVVVVVGWAVERLGGEDEGVHFGAYSEFV